MNFNKAIMRLEENVLAFCMLLVSITVIIQVIARYIFSYPLIGTEDIARFCVIWMTFWGTSYCARKGSHVCMGAIINKCPEKFQKFVHVIMLITAVLFSLYLTYLGWDLVTNTMRRGAVSPALRTPLWYVYLSAPTGFLLTSFHYIRILIFNFKNEGVYTSCSKEERGIEL